MTLQRMGVQTVGACARRLPRGRTRLARLLTTRYRDEEVEYTDVFGFRRTARLGDEMQARGFTGAVRLLPESVIHLRAGYTAIDVGANVGSLTAQMCRLVGPTGRVLAIEPVPANVRRLTELRDANELAQLQVAAVAVGATPGRATLRLGDPRNSGHASFDASWISHGEIDVDVATIDSLVAAWGCPVNFMKLDVEGHESNALEGARRVLREDRPVVQCEFNSMILRDIGSSPAALLTQFADLGYKPAQDYGPLEGRVTDVLLVPCAQLPTNLKSDAREEADRSGSTGNIVDARNARSPRRVRGRLREGAARRRQDST